MYRHTDNETTNQIDQQDDNARNGVSLDKFAGTIHRSEKVGFTFDLAPTFSSLLFINHAGVQIGIDTHLFTGHRIQCKPGAYLSYTLRTLRNNNELDDNKDEEDNESNSDLSSGNPAAERCYYLTRMSSRQNQLGG
ncbi:hypothetical protein D3C75_801120 [compost metagenome]